MSGRSLSGAQGWLRRLAVTVALVLAVASCERGGNDSARPEGRVPLDQWHQAWTTVNDEINQLHAGGEGRKPFEEQCRDGEKEFEDRRSLLLAPEDERLREAVPAWVDVVERYYDACRSGDKEGRAKVMRDGREPAEVLDRRVRELRSGG